jgi:hypothetical protein
VGMGAQNGETTATPPPGQTEWQCNGETERQGDEERGRLGIQMKSEFGP